MADIRVQGLHSLTFILKGRGKAPQWDQPSTPQSVPSALDQLMSTAKARHLPSQIDVNNSWSQKEPQVLATGADLKARPLRNMQSKPVANLVTNLPRELDSDRDDHTLRRAESQV